MCNRNVFSRVREEGGERRKEEGGGEGCMRNARQEWRRDEILSSLLCTQACMQARAGEEEERKEEWKRRPSVVAKMEKEAHIEITMKKEAYAERGRGHHDREGERGEEERNLLLLSLTHACVHKRGRGERNLPYTCRHACAQQRREISFSSPLHAHVPAGDEMRKKKRRGLGDASP